MEISQELASGLTKELNKDIKQHNLSGKNLVNYFYDNYIRTENNRDRLEAPGDKIGYLQQSDRHNADKKTNAELTKWLVEQRGDLIHADTLRDFKIKPAQQESGPMGPKDAKKYKVTHETRSASQSQSR